MQSSRLLRYFENSWATYLVLGEGGVKKLGTATQSIGTRFPKERVGPLPGQARKKGPEEKNEPSRRDRPSITKEVGGRIEIGVPFTCGLKKLIEMS